MPSQIHACIEDLLIVRINHLRHRARVIQCNKNNNRLSCIRRITLRSDMEKVLSTKRICEGRSSQLKSSILEGRCCNRSSHRWMNCQPRLNCTLKMTLRPMRSKWSPACGTIVATLGRPAVNSSPLKDVSLSTDIDRIGHNFTRDWTQELIRNYRGIRDAHFELLDKLQSK